MIKKSFLTLITFLLMTISVAYAGDWSKIKIGQKVLIHLGMARMQLENLRVQK